MNPFALLRLAVIAQRKGVSRNDFITNIPQPDRFRAFEQWDRALHLSKMRAPTEDEIRATQRYLAMTRRLLQYFSSRPPSPWAPKTKQALIDEFVFGLAVEMPENMAWDAKPVRAFMEEVTAREVDAERENAIIALTADRSFLRSRLSFDKPQSDLACSDLSSWRSAD